MKSEYDRIVGKNFKMVLTKEKDAARKREARKKQSKEKADVEKEKARERMRKLR